MIEILQMLPNNVVGFTARGEVTANDYETVLIPEVESRLNQSDKVRIFCYLGPEFSGFSAGAMWDDLKMALRHLKSWEKIAVVTDKRWINSGVSTFQNVIPCPIIVFNNEQYDQAKTWIAA